MNCLNGTIETIKVFQSLTHVRVQVQNHFFSTIVIDTPETANYLSIGNPVKVLFKETEVVIGRGDLGGISLQNKIEGIVKSVDKGSCRQPMALEDHLAGYPFPSYFLK